MTEEFAGEMKSIIAAYYDKKKENKRIMAEQLNAKETAKGAAKVIVEIHEKKIAPPAPEKKERKRIPFTKKNRESPLKNNL